MPQRDSPLPSVDIIDWLLFLIFVACFAFNLIFHDIEQRIALLFGRNAHDGAVRRLNYFNVLCLKILGTKFDIKLECTIPKEGPVILMSNHQSLFDISVLANIFSPVCPRFVAKKELSKWIPSVSYNLRNGLNGIIDRANPRQAIPEIKKLAENANEGKFAVIIFPEGTRAREGKLKAFRPAGVSVLLDHCPDAPVYPVVIDGSWILAARKFGPIPRGTTFHVVVKPPIERHEGEDTKAIIQQAHEIIAAELKQVRDQG